MIDKSKKKKKKKRLRKQEALTNLKRGVFIFLMIQNMSEKNVIEVPTASNRQTQSSCVLSRVDILLTDLNLLYIESLLFEKDW